MKRIGSLLLSLALILGMMGTFAAAEEKTVVKIQVMNAFQNLEPVLEEYYKRDYDMKTESQMDALTRVLRRIDPYRIAIDVSDHFACMKNSFAYSGLSSRSLSLNFFKSSHAGTLSLGS